MVVCTQSWRNVRPVNGSCITNDMQGKCLSPSLYHDGKLYRSCFAISKTQVTRAVKDHSMLGTQSKDPVVWSIVLQF